MHFSLVFHAPCTRFCKTVGWLHIHRESCLSLTTCQHSTLLLLHIQGIYCFDHWHLRHYFVFVINALAYCITLSPSRIHTISYQCIFLCFTLCPMHFSSDVRSTPNFLHIRTSFFCCHLYGLTCFASVLHYVFCEICPASISNHRFSSTYSLYFCK